MLDLTVAGLILLIVLPLMVLCALAIRLTSPGPVIYRQARIGCDGRQFTCFKFRTMVQSAEPAIDQLIAEGSAYHDEWASLYKLRADPRVTALGRFLRRFSIDELPGAGIIGTVVTKFNPKSAGVRYGGADYYNY